MPGAKKKHRSLLCKELRHILAAELTWPVNQAGRYTRPSLGHRAPAVRCTSLKREFRSCSRPYGVSMRILARLGHLVPHLQRVAKALTVDDGSRLLHSHCPAEYPSVRKLPHDGLRLIDRREGLPTSRCRVSFAWLCPGMQRVQRSYQDSCDPHDGCYSGQWVAKALYCTSKSWCRKFSICLISVCWLLPLGMGARREGRVLLKLIWS